MHNVFALLALLNLACVTLAFGGVYPWAYWPTAVFSASLGLWAIVGTRAWNDRYSRRTMWCLLAVGAGLVAQTIPLPRAWFTMLSPAGDRVLNEVSITYLLHPPPSHALSLSPDSTWVVLAFFSGVGALLVGGIAVFSTASPEAFVKRFVPLGVALAVVGLVQRAMVTAAPSDAPQVIYGFWAIKSSSATIFPPFINRNHFAGWMLMALPVVLAYACATGERAGAPFGRSVGAWVRWVITPEANRPIGLAGAAVIMGAALVFTGSRSGMGSFVVALSALGYFITRRVAERQTRRLLLGSLAAIFVVAVAWAGVSGVIARFALASGDLQFRVMAWKDTLRIIHDFPWFGVGFGGYLTAMLSYQSFGRTMFFADAHNDYLQIAAEGGLLVGVPALICLIALIAGVRGRIVRRADDRTSYWIRSGAIAGLCGIAAQSFFDFSLQIPANTTLFVLVAALALHRPSPARRIDREQVRS